MRLGLMIKFSIISALVLLFTMSLFTLFNIAGLRRAFMDVYTNDVDNLSETIIATTSHAMLSGEVDEAYQLMERAGTQENIKNIRLIDKHGTIRFSLKKEEIGTFVDSSRDPGCDMCHFAGEPRVQASTMDRRRVFPVSEGEEVLGVIRGIYNEPACSEASCHYHPADVNLLGVLDIVVSTKEVVAQITSYRNNVLVELVFLVIALSLCLNLLTRKLITHPVNTLLDHTRMLSRGEWGYIENITNDEFGELAESFNDMTRSLKKAEEERERWAATLETKVEERTQQIKEMQSVIVRSEKLASLGELAAGIAHELNNPLTGIVLHASIIEENQDLPPRVKEEIGTITWEADRCARIVKNLLDFSRKTEPRKGMNSVNETLDRALGLVEHLASFHNIDIVREYADNLPDLLIDPGQMEQVFVNMFVNASQAMEDGGKLILWTGLDVDGESVIVRIKDTGRGIPKGHLGRIFDPFFSTKGAKGTGLGLSVSYGIIEGHGGTIEVQSEVGKGTEFTITIPV
ncbi:MAG: HAMP domain-containing protein [bacterium]|nr:MAG: HAMP domain-containing protein [bacterium]